MEAGGEFPHALALSQSSQPAGSTPQQAQAKGRRRMRTKEISAGPVNPDLARKQPDPDGSTSNQSESSSSKQQWDLLQLSSNSATTSSRAGTLQRLRHSRRKSSSATLSSEGSERNPLERSDSISSESSGAQTIGRRSWIPSTPSNAWLQRISGSSKILTTAASPAKSLHISTRDRSGSVTSLGPSSGSTDQSTETKGAGGSPRKFSDIRKSLTRNTSVSSRSSSNGKGTTKATPSGKSKNSALFFGLSPTNRAREEGPPSASTSISGAKSGLDRAIRYFFVDSSEQAQSLTEGIWLLGVWHGIGMDDKVFSSQPTIEVTQATPRTRQSRSSTDEVDTSFTSRRGSDAEYDDLSIENGSRGTRETSPSIASASTEGSLRLWDNRISEESAGDRCREDDSNASFITTAKSAVNGSAALSSASPSPSPSLSPSHLVSFQSDFSSRIWCTYRSHFVPISRDGSITYQAESAAALASAEAALLQTQSHDEGESSGQYSGQATPTMTVKVEGDDCLPPEKSAAASSQLSSQVASLALSSSHSIGLGSLLGIGNATSSSGLGEKIGLPNLWGRATAAAQAYGLGGRAGLTTDAGWGCMLRTGQSVLANALMNVHLGRGWRRDVALSKLSEGLEGAELQQAQEEYATYVKLLSWFMDEPSLACPFGVHRMAREGKRLGKEVGEWFGPSTAGGAIKKLVDEYPAAGVGVSLASDGVVYLDQVKAQSQSVRQGKVRGNAPYWARPVLILIGVRLGLEGVHPMYHESIKAIFSFPQSVGIAGGRPSSSYYFVGYQGNSLFYLDPHHVRPSIKFRHPPPDVHNETEWWLHAYGETELATFHTDRPRKMPMKTLDPSMLLGFLITDEESMEDFASRIKALPRPIFSVLETMPTWMMEGDEGMLHDEERALESFSEGSHEEDSVKSDTATAERVERQNIICFPARGGDDFITSEQNVMTPRSESTFEFVDRQQGLHLPEFQRQDSTATATNSLHDTERPPVLLNKVETLRSERSVAVGDDTSAWEEVTTIQQER